MKTFACFALAAGLVAATGALAHPKTRAATPPPDAELTASPPLISITFSEGLIAAFSGLELDDAAGKAQALGPVTVGGADKKTMSAPVKAHLAPGTYTVNWHAVGDDTHHVTGHYSFEVKP
ncbi:MAG: copper homeostasis periplasmic binding protein CopC [Caulobacterales bacterium]